MRRGFRASFASLPPRRATRRGAIVMGDASQGRHRHGRHAHARRDERHGEAAVGVEPTRYAGHHRDDDGRRAPTLQRLRRSNWKARSERRPQGRRPRGYQPRGSRREDDRASGQNRSERPPQATLPKSHREEATRHGAARHASHRPTGVAGNGLQEVPAARTWTRSRRSPKGRRPRRSPIGNASLGHSQTRTNWWVLRQAS